MHTANPAYPHPDQDSDNVTAWPLGKAIAYAIKTLHNPNATQDARNYAASELDAAYCQHEAEQ